MCLKLLWWEWEIHMLTSIKTYTYTDDHRTPSCEVHILGKTGKWWHLLPICKLTASFQALSFKAFARLSWYCQLWGSQILPKLQWKMTSKSEKIAPLKNIKKKIKKQTQNNTYKLSFFRHFFLSPTPCCSSWSLWGIRMPSCHRDCMQGCTAISLLPLHRWKR